MKYKRRHDTIVIHGSHPNARRVFDWTRDDCDIWVFNEAVKTETNNGFAPPEKVNAVFQLHKPVIWKNPNNRNDKDHYKWLQETDIPVWMQDEYPEIKASIKYPLDEIKSTLTSELLSSSVAQAMALAVYLGYKKVEVWGVEMETGSEWEFQRPGVAFWSGYLMGKGIEVDAHWNIFNQPVYGFEGDVALKYEEFTSRIEKLIPECDRLQNYYREQHKKTSDALNATVMTGNRNIATEFAKEFQTLLDMGREFGRLDGMRQECERYKKKADDMIEAGGEFLFSRQEFEGGYVSHGKSANHEHSESQVAGGRFEALFNGMLKILSQKNRIRQMKTIVPIMETYVQAAVKASMHAGGAELNRELMVRLDALIKAAGGSKSEEVMLEAMQ